MTPQITPDVSVRYADGTILAAVSRATTASPDRVWDVMTDHPGYADVASNISRVEVLDGSGPDMRRKCFGPKGESWSETCTHYDEGTSFGFRVHTDAADYPYPFASVTGRWSVAPDPIGSCFTIDIKVVPKGGAFKKRALFLLSRRQFHKILHDLANAWAKRMERTE